MQECVAHTQAFDEDCEYCRAEVNAKHNELQDLTEKNNNTVRDIRRSGGELEPLIALDVRLGMLLRSIYSPKQLLAFELAFQGNMEEILSEIVSSMTRNKLQVPVMPNVMKFKKP